MGAPARPPSLPSTQHRAHDFLADNGDQRVQLDRRDRRPCGGSRNCRGVEYRDRRGITSARRNDGGGSGAGRCAGGIHGFQLSARVDFHGRRGRARGRARAGSAVDSSQSPWRGFSAGAPRDAIAGAHGSAARHCDGDGYEAGDGKSDIEARPGPFASSADAAWHVDPERGSDLDRPPSDSGRLRDRADRCSGLRRSVAASVHGAVLCAAWHCS